MLNSIGGYLKQEASYSEEPPINNSLLTRGEVRVKQEAIDSEGGSLVLDSQLPATRAAPSAVRVPPEGLQKPQLPATIRAKSSDFFGLGPWSVPATPAAPSAIRVKTEGSVDPPLRLLPDTLAAYRESVVTRAEGVPDTRTEHPGAPSAVQAPLQSLSMNGSASCLSARIKAETCDAEDGSQRDKGDRLTRTVKIKTETSESEDDSDEEFEEDGVLRVKKEETDDEDSSELPSSSVYLGGFKQNKMGRGKHSCDECVVSFKSEKFLGRHLKTFHGPNSCQCAVCGRRFSKESTLLKHKKTHFKWTRPGFQNSGGVKLFACRECDESLSSRKQRVRHRREAHGHRCLKCSRIYMKEAPLIEHMRTHSRQRPYACVCLAGFQTMRSLAKHSHKCPRKLKWDHQSSKCCLCNLCGQRFGKPSCLRNHLLESCSPMPPLW